MNIYIVRHAQAGSLENYDQISELGRLQAKKLGEFFHSKKIYFDCLISGTLKRHILTLNYIIDNPSSKNYFQFECLNEISEESFKNLLNWYKEKDHTIKFIYKKFLTNNLKNSQQKYLYMVLLKKIFENWILDNNFNYSFSNFKTKVYEFFFELENLISRNNYENILVISSGTPIVLLIGKILKLDDQNSLELLKKIYNTSYTILKVTNIKPIEFQIQSMFERNHLLPNEVTLI